MDGRGGLVDLGNTATDSFEQLWARHVSDDGTKIIGGGRLVNAHIDDCEIFEWTASDGVRHTPDGADCSGIGWVVKPDLSFGLGTYSFSGVGGGSGDIGAYPIVMYEDGSHRDLLQALQIDHGLDITQFGWGPDREDIAARFMSPNGRYMIIRDGNNHGLITREIPLGPCLGDCDNSGEVEFNDLVAMLFQVGDIPVECDVDSSGAVDFNDLVAALFLFGPCPE